jgi:hypothetical protein
MHRRSRTQYHQENTLNGNILTAAITAGIVLAIFVAGFACGRKLAPQIMLPPSPGHAIVAAAIGGRAQRRVTALETIAPSGSVREAFVEQVREELQRRTGDDPSLAAAFGAAIHMIRHRDAARYVATLQETYGSEFELPELEALARSCTSVPDLPDRIRAVSMRAEAAAAAMIAATLQEIRSAAGAAAPVPSPRAPASLSRITSDAGGALPRTMLGPVPPPSSPSS